MPSISLPPPPTGSLPVWVVVIFILIGVIAIALTVFLIYQRKNFSGYTRLVKRRSPVHRPSKTKHIIFPPDEENPKPPPTSTAPLRPFLLTHARSSMSMGGANQMEGISEEESQTLLPPNTFAASQESAQLEIQSVMLELHRLTSSHAPIPTPQDRARIVTLRARMQELMSRSRQERPASTYQPYHEPNIAQSPQALKKGWQG